MRGTQICMPLARRLAPARSFIRMRKSLALITAAAVVIGGASLMGCQEDRADDDMNVADRGRMDNTSAARTAGSGTAVGSGASSGVNAAGERTSDSTGTSGARTGEGVVGPTRVDTAGRNPARGRESATGTRADDDIDTGAQTGGSR